MYVIMKTKNFLAVIAVVFLIGFVSSCTKTDTAETETLYGQDKGIQRPGTQK